MPSQNFYVGFCDTYIDNIRCKIFYPSQNNKKYASKSNDLRKTKASKKNNSISILLVRYWCEVHFKKICRIFAWPMFIKFYDWLWNRNTDDPNGFQANNYFKFDVWNRSVPYEIETSLNGLDTLDFSCPNDSSTSSNPTPDQELLSSMLKDTSTKKVIIYHGGVGTSIDYYYTKFCQRISKELNALVVIPEFSCGTLLYRVDRKNKKIQHYSYEIPMYTNNQERKDQNDIRSVETYRVTKVLQDIMKNVNQRVIPTDVIGHSLGGGSAIHLLANQEENDRKVFEKIVGLGPSLGVGMTDLDWKNVLEMKYDTKVLQILENLYYYKDFPNNAICARLGVADQNYGNFKKQKQFIVTINKCNHCDIFDLSCRPLNKYSWWEKKQWGVAGLLPDDPLISFENQIFLTCSFLDGADINELVSFENQDWFVDGVTLKDKLDMQKVQNSVNRLLSTQ